MKFKTFILSAILTLFLFNLNIMASVKAEKVDAETIVNKDIGIVIDAKTPFNPLKLQTVFLENLPQNIRHVKVKLSFPDTNSNSVFETEHTTFYPVIRYEGYPPFINMNFFWMFSSDNLLKNYDTSEKIKKLYSELPNKLLVTIYYDGELTPYYELLKVNYNETTAERNAMMYAYYRDSELIVENQAVQQTETGKIALIFVHGIQGGQLQSVFSNFSDSPFVWKNYDRKNYWKLFYDPSYLNLFDGLSISDIEFYEYQYDSYFDSSKGYGQKLAALIEKSGLLKKYDDIIIISHSMGTVVARYAMNTTLSYSDAKEKLGNHISNLILMGSLLEGAFFSNLADSMLAQTFKIFDEEAGDYQYDFSENNLKLLYDALYVAFDYKKVLFDPERIRSLFATLPEFYFSMPVIFGGLFSSFYDIPFIGGQLVLYPGMSSLKYTDEKFLKTLSLKTHHENDSSSYVNQDLKELNLYDEFTDKETVFSSYIRDENAFLKGFTTLSFILKNILEKSGSKKVRTDKNWYLKDSIYPELNIPIIRNMIQRVLCKIISDFADSLEKPEHSSNDGFVTLWSQKMLGNSESNASLPEIIEFFDLDHAQIKENPKVIENIFLKIYEVIFKDIE